jgi:ribosomal RNA-processing protein 36
VKGTREYWAWRAPAQGMAPRSQMEAVPSRLNKNRPAQMSSKRAVSTLRIAPGLSAGSSSERTLRDPRFDAISKGEVNEHVWRQKYAFVFDKQREEVQEIKQALAASKAAAKAATTVAGRKKRKRGGAKPLSAEEEEALKLEVSRKSNQLREYDRAIERQKLKSVVRKQELAAISEGKRPFFKKARDLKEAELSEQYRQLQDKGQLDKYMAKKRKQRASKQRKALPNQRHSWGDEA